MYYKKSLFTQRIESLTAEILEPTGWFFGSALETVFLRLMSIKYEFV